MNLHLMETRITSPINGVPSETIHPPFRFTEKLTEGLRKRFPGTHTKRKQRGKIM